MSSTRYAKPGSPLNQNRYASSGEFNPGLRANLVAMRCSVLESPEDRELIWMLQEISLRDDGLKGFAAEILARFAHRLGTRSMRQFGLTAKQSFNAEQVRAIRKEFSGDVDGEEMFPLRGEVPGWVDPDDDWQLKEEKAKAARYPDGYPVADFLNLCRAEAGNSGAWSLADRLCKICLDPKSHWDVWYFHELRDCLCEYRSTLTTPGFAPTALSRTIWREIQDVHEMPGMILLHNDSGNGKSDSAKAYCQTQPGRARYCIVPSSNTEVDFWRALAGAVGTADGMSYKCEQIRTRVKETLLSAGLVLVLDNAQNLFPVSDYRYALPGRLNQIIELAEQGVSFVLIANSKLFDTLGFVEARTGWSRSQFVNQLTRVVELPAGLDRDDVEAVAAQLLPDGDRAAQRKLADSMIVAPGYLHAGKRTAAAARRIAAAKHRDRVTLADLSEAVETDVVPSCKALASGLQRADAVKSKSKSKARNWRAETDAQLAAKKARRHRNQILTSTDLKQSPAAEAADPNFSPLTGPQRRINTPDPQVSVSGKPAADLALA
jgi:hypothetical protein